MSGSIWHSKLTMPVSTARDHIRGPVSALVTLVEYGDYECPYCGAAHAIVKTIMGQVDDAVRFVFRHFPMTSVHPYPNLRQKQRRQPAISAGFGTCMTPYLPTSNASMDRRCSHMLPNLASI